MVIEKGLLYAESHEWARLEGKEAVIGITDFAQSELNDVVYVELPLIGESLKQGERFGSVESVKAASDVYLPLSGTVVAVNEALGSNPGLVNTKPYTDGWFLRISVSEPTETGKLMDAAKYEQFVAQPAH